MVVAWCSTTLSGTALFEGGSGQDPSPETAAAGRFEAPEAGVGCESAAELEGVVAGRFSEDAGAVICFSSALSMSTIDFGVLGAGDCASFVFELGALADLRREFGFELAEVVEDEVLVCLADFFGIENGEILLFFIAQVLRRRFPLNEQNVCQENLTLSFIAWQHADVPSITDIPFLIIRTVLEHR